MPGKSKIYLIDSDVLISIKQRTDSNHIYKEISKLVDAGHVKTVRQVYKETTADESVKPWITSLKSEIVIPPEEQYCTEVQDKLGILTAQAGHLWPQTGGTAKDPADPWLIAVASVYGYCVVTNENARSHIKIPAGCNISGTKCECISGPHFLYETGIVTEVNPAHISPKEFFGD